MNYVPGLPPSPLPLGLWRIAVLICYESMVTDQARAMASEGAEFLVIPTNDAWFGQSSAAAHHFDMAIMRAVETGRPTIQAGNTGISGFVTPTGEVLAESRLDERRTLVANLAPVAALTPYTRFGDVLAWACLVGTLAQVLGSSLRRR